MSVLEHTVGVCFTNGFRLWAITDTSDEVSCGEAGDNGRHYYSSETSSQCIRESAVAWYEGYN